MLSKYAALELIRICIIKFKNTVSCLSLELSCEVYLDYKCQKQKWKLNICKQSMYCEKLCEKITKGIQTQIIT